MNYTLPTSGVTAPQCELVPLPCTRHAELLEVARQDGHRLIAPTHVVLKGGQIIGYGSIGKVPLFFAWMHTQRASARDSFRAWQLAERVAKEQGLRQLLMPCSRTSPFHPFMPRMGYESLGELTLNLKDLHVH